MFQLWNLVLLCGLLTGTLASLLGDLGNGLNAVDPVKSIVDNAVSAVDPVKSVLGNGVSGADPVKSIVDNAVSAVDPLKSVLGNDVNVADTLKPVLNKADALQNLKLDLGALQETKDLLLAKSNILEVLNLGLPSLPELPSVVNGLRLKIDSLRILDIQAGLAKDGKGIELKFPLAAHVSLYLPLLGNVVDLNVNLNLISGLTVETDPKTNLPVLKVSECSSDGDKISLSLLGRQNALVNLALDAVSKVAEKTVTYMLQKQVCPIINFFTTPLKVELVESLRDFLQLLRKPLSI